jgi:hypothetical protein
MGVSTPVQEGVYMLLGDKRNTDFAHRTCESTQCLGGPLVVITTNPFTLDEDFDALSEVQSKPSRLNSAILRRALLS